MLAPEMSISAEHVTRGFSSAVDASSHNDFVLARDLMCVAVVLG